MFEAIRQKLATGLFPLSSPKLLDSSETALGGLHSPEVVSLSVLNVLAVPNPFPVGDVNLFLPPGNGLAIPIDLAQPQIIGKGLTDELESLKFAKPEITVPLDESSILQHPHLLTVFGEPDFLALQTMASFFDELSPPQLLGRVYTNRSIDPDGPRSYNGTGAPGYRDRDRCRHGLRFCGRCNRSPTPQNPSSSNRTRTSPRCFWPASVSTATACFRAVKCARNLSRRQTSLPLPSRRNPVAS